MKKANARLIETEDEVFLIAVCPKCRRINKHGAGTQLAKVWPDLSNRQCDGCSHNYKMELQP